MPNYIRNRNSGATYFSTINLHDRQSNLLITQVNELRQAYQKVQQKCPLPLTPSYPIISMRYGHYLIMIRTIPLASAYLKAILPASYQRI